MTLISKFFFVCLFSYTAMATEVDVAIYGDPLGESFSEGEITPPSKEIESVQTTTSLDGVPRISDHFLGKERLNSLR